MRHKRLFLIVVVVTAGAVPAAAGFAREAAKVTGTPQQQAFVTSTGPFHAVNYLFASQDPKLTGTPQAFVTSTGPFHAVNYLPSRT